MDKIKIKIGVISVSQGAGASFVAASLDHMLNKDDSPRLFVSRPDKYLILDSPNRPDDMDIIICVIDPLPSKLIEGAGRYALLRSMKVSKIWLVNKDNQAVDHRELEKFLELKPDIYQEALPYEAICRAEYNCETPCEAIELKGIRELADRIRRL